MSSLSSLPAPSNSSSNHSSSSSAAPSSGDESMAALLARIEALERKQRPPTPHPVAAHPRSLASSGSRRGQSVGTFLGGGASRVSLHQQDSGDVKGDDDGDGVGYFNDVDDGDDQTPLAVAGAGPSSYPSSSSAAAPATPIHPLHGPIAPSVLEDIGSGGFREWLRIEAPQSSWKNSRNLHEVTVLADALDALVGGKHEDAIEILVRRFIGVRHADLSGNWNVAAALASDLPRRTLLRPSILSAVLREAKNLSLLERGTTRRGVDGADAARGGRGRGRGRGRGGGTNTQSHAATTGAAAHTEAQPRAGGGGHA